MWSESGKDTEYWNIFKEERVNFIMILIRKLFLEERIVVYYVTVDDIDIGLQFYP